MSGEGADEFFAGYVGYRFDKMREKDLVKNAVSTSERNLRSRVWNDENFFYEVNFAEFDKVKRNLYSDEMNFSFDDINCLNYPVIKTDRINNRSILDKRSYIDYKIRLVDHLVSDHGDRMAMANSVEVRYPFMDKRLVEFSTHIPAELKLRGFTEKYILKQMAGRFVPDAIINREKFGFTAPGSPYLLNRNIEFINDILSYDRIKREGYFNPNQIEKLKQSYKQPGYTINVPFESDLLITVITFGIFLDKYFS